MPQALSLDERFWAKVDKTPTCWIWTAALTRGYGTFGQKKPTKTIKAHRYAYEQAYGPIPQGLEPDHLCRNRACVRPDHMEAVTPRENRRRAQTTATANPEKGKPSEPSPLHRQRPVLRNRSNSRRCPNEDRLKTRFLRMTDWTHDAETRSDHRSALEAAVACDDADDHLRNLCSDALTILDDYESLLVNYEQLIDAATALTDLLKDQQRLNEEMITMLQGRVQ